MVKKDISEEEILAKISDLYNPLNEVQKEYLIKNLTVQTYKKNEPIYSEGEYPTQLICLLSGKVKIFKNGVGNRNQIIRVSNPWNISPTGPILPTRLMSQQLLHLKLP